MSSQDPFKASVHGETTVGGVCEFATPGSLPPCTLVIFGASGDLTARKLIPAFYSLHLSNNLPEPFTIVGSSRTAWSNEEFREKLRQATVDEAGMDAELNSLDAQVIRNYVYSLNLKNKSSSVARKLSALRSFFKFMEQEKVTLNNSVNKLLRVMHSIRWE